MGLEEQKREEAELSCNKVMRKIKIDIYLDEPLIKLLHDDADEQSLLEKYNYNEVNKKPLTEKQLYRYYQNNATLFLRYYHKVMGEPSFELSNEIRAMLGHLADYRLKEEPLKTNLEKAYGHFRRLNIDAFKILCDEYDKFFSNELSKFYKYDFSEEAASFLEKYLEFYFKAREQYLEAQNAEDVGSNNTNNVYKYYFDALRAYIELKNYYLKKRKAVIAKKRKSIIFKAISIVASIALSVLNIYTLLP